jgi:two-component system LytT family response regulator
MNVIIIDDETAVRNTITCIIRENIPDIRIMAYAGSVAEGIEVLKTNQPDLLLLDVEMHDGTGFDLLSAVSPVIFRVIFVTGHQEYALKAIKVSAIDYILKPVDKDDLVAAIAKARTVISHEEEQMKLAALSDNMQGKKVLKRIILKSADSLQLVALRDIIRAEADSNYTHFRLSGGKHVIVSRTIKEFEGMLAGSAIIRVHQSHLVNLDHVDKFIKRDGGYLHLKDGSSVPVSPNLKQKVLQAISDHLYE